MLEILPAETPAQLDDIRTLTDELGAWDRIETAMAGFDAQAMADFYYDAGESLPGAYARPAGCLLLATDAHDVVGCIGFRPSAPGTCEVKHLWVRPAHRGKNAGRALVEALIAEGRNAGYRTMRLETTTFMKNAVPLYSSLGFRKRAP